jgi:hypothetical protein
MEIVALNPSPDSGTKSLAREARRPASDIEPNKTLRLANGTKD